MRAYYEIAKSQVKLDFAYGAWFWSSMVSSILQMLVLFYFWRAVYANGPSELHGYKLDDMITYMVVASMIGGYTNGAGGKLAEDIRGGLVAIELMRPYDQLSKLVALDLGGKFGYFLRNTVPILVLAFLFFHINLPPSWGAAAMFPLSTALGVLIGAQFDLLVGIMAFYTVNIWGLRVLRDAVLLFFTGQLVPVMLFPEWLQSVNRFLPFQSMVYVPVSIYTGALRGAEAWVQVGIQAAWLLGVFLLVRWTWSRAMRKVTIFGG
ncbi:hypothetical protein EL26_20425 [Tumebacillus flagellatus]|uniref:ABC transporter permease n=1 Tax=Tumebacillus flagellatus TaxID=1157490 RepID=A0A074LLK6_9BACL|nr:hypothetical protein EL26_20425 [Tumebacillus flagellatus]